MMALGTKAPDFNLKDVVSGETMDLNSVRGSNGTLVIFICNHCPYVHHVIENFSEKAKEWISKGIGVVAISSNDVESYPEDSPELMNEFARDHRFSFPYLYDPSQEVARSYDAACTPDPYLFDPEDACVYRGQLDTSKPGNGIEVDSSIMDEAITRMLEGKEMIQNQVPSMGCNIKWKAS